MSERFVCIHGHFYQPPRENPWLEAVELQDSAYPFHDWNDRITTECYAPNAASRILDGDGRILRIVNNYASISYNVGPTLMAWLAERRPEVHDAIVAADRTSRDRFSGHGSAMAQAYNHMILPLASPRDRRTQVLWGIRDFRHRFGRDPEGMWLPETAVDLATLEVLAAVGIRFTVLAPRQAARVRALHGDDDGWSDVSGGRIDPTRPYLQRLPSGNEIALFFYDGPVSQAVAFERLLDRGEALAGRLEGAFSEEREWDQLVHIATDGETYGHHHRHGEMALSWALEHLESEGLARLTNYAEFLATHPPTHEVEIVEDSSWSCIHGIERWRADCGCSSGGHPGWSQAWRAPLRAALDWLRGRLEPLYEERAGRLLAEPWAARDDYIEVLLDRSPETVAAFLQRHAGRPVEGSERVQALRLLELQRHAMLMYTSCGWFFDELSGIETVQILQYAGRAIQLAHDLTGDDDRIEEDFLGRLAAASSNLSGYGDGRRIYERFVRPAMVDLTKVGAHYAVSSAFEEYEPTQPLFCYTIDRHDGSTLQAGRSRLVLGHARVSSHITTAALEVSYGVLHFGDHNLAAGVRSFQGDAAYRAMVEELSDSFARADVPDTLRLLDSHLGAADHSLRTLFRDEQRKVLDHVLHSTGAAAEGLYRRVYLDNGLLVRFLDGLGAPVPRALATAAAFVLNVDLERALAADPPDFTRAHEILEEAEQWGSRLSTEVPAFALVKTLEHRMRTLLSAPGTPAVSDLAALVEKALDLGFELDLWSVQNLYFSLLEHWRDDRREAAAQGDEDARAWLEAVDTLGTQLGAAVR